MAEIALVSKAAPAQMATLRSLCAPAYEVVDYSDDRDRLASRGERVEIVYGMVRPLELEKLPRLRWVQATWTGVENLMYPAMVESDVLVTCSKGHCSTPLAETVLAAILHFARDIPGFQQKEWRKDWDVVAGMRVVEGSQALILGMGVIGQVVAQKLQALGLRVRGVNSTGQTDGICIDMHSLESVRGHLGDVDYCVDCLPGTPRTYRYVEDGFLGALAPGAVFANVGRGSTVDEAALLRHLDSGHLAGAMLDVSDPEPPDPASPLLSHRRVLHTGHQATFPLCDTDWPSRPSSRI